MPTVLFFNRQDTDGGQITCPVCRTNLNTEQVSVDRFLLHAWLWFGWKYESDIEDKLVVPTPPFSRYFHEKKL